MSITKVLNFFQLKLENRVVKNGQVIFLRSLAGVAKQGTLLFQILESVVDGPFILGAEGEAGASVTIN